MRRFVIAVLAGLATTTFALAPAAASGSSGGLGTAKVTVGAPVNVTPISCSFPVTLTWSGFAGNSDTAALWMEDSLFGTVTGVFQQPKVKGASGAVSHIFDGLIPGASYSGWAELLDGHGNPILGSLVFSSFTAC